MTFTELRDKHPHFHYRSFFYQVDKSEEVLRIEFVFEIPPDIVFRPRLEIPIPKDYSSTDMDAMVFNLGLVEMISYWKATVSPRLIVHAGTLNKEQIEWWTKLILRGMGEYFAVNGIDPNQQDLFRIETESESLFGRSELITRDKSHLIMVGGGKDSCLTMQLITDNFPENDNQGFMLNPTQAALETAEIAGFVKPLIVKRAIDPKLMELNEQGYLNGHTPFSAYLAFLGILVAQIHGYKYVLASNEQSANEATKLYKGVAVNHQYSKTYEFEKDFRFYCSDYLTGNSQYVSFLRPLYELKIASEFVNFPQYFEAFLSCNVGGKINRWCGNCPKCLFNYLILEAFLNKDEMDTIFISSVLDNLDLANDLRGLLMDNHPKPFECVGTKEESRIACRLIIDKYIKLGKRLPKLLEIAKELLSDDVVIKDETDRLLNHFDNDHFLPEHLENVLIRLRG